MWETSKMPQEPRTARCSWRTPSYWTGISQPAKSTSFAPADDVAVKQGRTARGARLPGEVIAPG